MCLILIQLSLETNLNEGRRDRIYTKLPSVDWLLGTAAMNCTATLYTWLLSALGCIQRICG